MSDLLGLVDAIARVQLAAKRAGYAIVAVQGAPAGLHDLIAFLGLDGVLHVERGSVEVRRQPVEREEGVGVEEERRLDDPSA